MKKLLLVLLALPLLFSCGGLGNEAKKVLIEGKTFTELNVRVTPNADNKDNVVYTLNPGDAVQIVSFNEGYDVNGTSWCEIKLENPQTYAGEELKYAWVAYKVKSLPFIVSPQNWEKIKLIYEMDYESGINEMLTGAKTWVTQAIYDYVYNDILKDIKYEYDNRSSDFNSSNPVDKYEIVSPSHSVDYTTENSYPQYCRVRITTASIERKEDALYAVVFNQTPRIIHLFRKDQRTGKGIFAKSFDFSNNLNSSIKSLERRQRSLYYSDYYGYKEKLDLQYDAIRIRLQKGRERYYVYNNNPYTNSDLSNLYYLDWITEY
jgi:hypothetical protein